MPKYASRRDENDPELARLARRLGALLLRYGPFDYWCGWRGAWRLVEIKRANKEGWKNEYTPPQTEILAQCYLRNVPVSVWRTREDVFRDLNDPTRPKG
jgi:hypothetical protein